MQILNPSPIAKGFGIEPMQDELAFEFLFPRFVTRLTSMGLHMAVAAPFSSRPKEATQTVPKAIA